MFRIRKSNERGFANHGWLKSSHTFSFAEYHDPDQMGFRSLRVINEDRIDSGTGFGSHPHRDMEIISYVVKGALEHKDSMGTKAIIRPGEVQRMSAGSGVVHSEYNANPDGVTHFFQIWILPKERGGTPGYGQKSFAERLNEENMVLVISQDGRDGSISIKQDVDMYISRIKAGHRIKFQLRGTRASWIQVVHGRLNVNQNLLETGDAFSFESTNAEIAPIELIAAEDTEIILFDLS